MDNFDYKDYIANNLLLKEEPQPYTDKLRREEAEDLATDIELEGEIAQRFIDDVMKATEDESWGTFYDIADKIMVKYM